ncbi:MAG: GntR family transcriptional regulator [Chloroflexi bacterium]|nr:GntR family transcriptional regulator [Chloroflexota bacterium]
MEDRRERASERAERLLIERILDGTYPPGTTLPGERDLARELGTARPALREALQRLARDGWLNIHQGKATEGNDYMRDGSLNVLSGLMQADLSLLPDFVPNLLEMWSLIAPPYTHAAVERDPRAVHEQLYGYRGLADRPDPYARAQWRLHRLLTWLSGNPVYGLVLNGFRDFYIRLSRLYYTDPARRAEARDFWRALYEAALLADGERAASLMWEYMQSIRRCWPELDVAGWLEEQSEVVVLDEEP